MNDVTDYREGQRWQLKTAVDEFEDTLVIAAVREAHPEWGQNQTIYEAYVRYSSLAKRSIPHDCDGVVLGLSAEGLDRSVTELRETGVELPWWWVYGRRVTNRSDAPRMRGVFSCDEVRDVLPSLYRIAREEAETARRRAEAIQRHLAKFREGVAQAPPSKSVAESWSRIAAWLAEHAPGYSFSLNEGASETAIADFEKTIRATLPDDFRESVRLHDGGDNCWIPPSHGDLLSLDQILEQWKMYRSWQQKGDYATEDWVPRKIRGPIKPVFWNLKRIYITDNSGDHLTLDLDPPEEGVYGQILDHSHEVGPTEVLAPSWSEFLSQLIQDLESGKYVYFDYEGSLEPLEWQEGRTGG